MDNNILFFICLWDSSIKVGNKQMPETQNQTRIKVDVDFFPKLRNRLQTFLKDYEMQFLSQEKAPLIDRFCCEIDTQDIMLLLSAFRMKLKVFWKSRDERFSALAMGSLYEIKHYLLGDVQTFLRDSGHYDFRFYGAVPFETHKNLRENWKMFKNIHFFLPRFEFIQEKSHCFFYAYFLPNRLANLWKDFKTFEESFHKDKRRKRKEKKLSATFTATIKIRKT